MDKIDNVFSTEGLYSDRSQEMIGVAFVLTSAFIALFTGLIIAALVKSGKNRRKAQAIFDNHKTEILEELKTVITLYNNQMFRMKNFRQFMLNNKTDIRIAGAVKLETRHVEDFLKKDMVKFIVNKSITIPAFSIDLDNYINNSHFEDEMDKEDILMDIEQDIEALFKLHVNDDNIETSTDYYEFNNTINGYFSFDFDMSKYEE